MSTTLPLFWHLSSSSSDERLEASTKLIRSLEQFQEQFKAAAPISSSEDTGSEEKEEQDPTRDDLDRYNAQDVSYTIRRLVRGLASPRESSRLGFSVALTELLTRIDTLDTQKVVQMVLSASQIQGSMTGQEERDMLFARLFGLTSIIQSGLCYRTGTVANRSSKLFTSPSDFNAILSELVSMGEAKPWLRESCWWTISRALENLVASSLSWRDTALSENLETLLGGSGNWTPEKVAIILKLQPTCTAQDWSSIVSLPFKGESILSTKNLIALSRILREEGTENENDKISGPSTSAWKPQLHFVWDTIIDSLSASAESADTVTLHEFLKVVVDEGLFANNSSSDRKYRGFQVVQKCLLRSKEEDLPRLFTPNMMRTWINNLSSNDRYLHKMSLQLAKNIQNIVSEKPATAMPIVMTLLGANGSLQFDKLTHTKTVESILTATNEESIHNYATYLIDQFNIEQDNSDSLEVKALNGRRSWAIDQMSTIVRNGAIPKGEPSIQMILDFLAVHGFFIVRSSKRLDKARIKNVIVITPPLSDELRALCRSRLLSCLSDLASRSSINLSVVPTTMTDRWISRVARSICELWSQPKVFTPVIDLDEDTTAVQARSLELMSRLQNLPKESQATAIGAELLISGGLLQILYEATENISLDSIEQCLSAVSQILDSLEGPVNGKQKAIPSDVTPIDVLVDIMIGYMEKGTSYLRTVATQALALLSGAVQATSIDLILAQLEHRRAGDSDEDESEEEPEETNQAIAGDDSEVTSENESDSSSSTDEGDHGEAETEVDIELRRKIEEALRINGVDRDVSDGSGDEDEESDEDLLDDDQMMQFDDKLAEVFRTRRADRNSGRDAQREATHFKNRMLDLIEVYIRYQPTSKFLVSLVLPLVQALLSCSKDEKQFSEKLTGLIRTKISKGKTLPSMDESMINSADDSLEQLHKLARKIHSQDHLITISAGCIYLSRILVRESRSETVAEAYQHSLSEFTGKKSCPLKPSFFEELCKRLPEVAWIMRAQFVAILEHTVNGFRKAHVFSFIATFLGQLKTDEKASHVFEYFKSFCRALCGTVASTCRAEEAGALTAQQLKEVCNSALTVARLGRKIGNSSAGWDLPLLKATGGLLDESDRFKQSGAAASWKRLLEIVTTPDQLHSNINGLNTLENKEKKEQVEAEAKEIVSPTISSVTKSKGKKRKESDDEAATSNPLLAEDANVRKVKRRKVRHKKDAEKEAAL